MKRLFNKHNPISRVVALWLVFVMMAVPFFSNSGLLSNPKANSGGTEVTADYSIGNITVGNTEIGFTNPNLNVLNSGELILKYYDIDKVNVSIDGVTLPESVVIGT